MSHIYLVLTRLHGPDHPPEAAPEPKLGRATYRDTDMHHPVINNVLQDLLSSYLGNRVR